MTLLEKVIATAIAGTIAAATIKTGALLMTTMEQEADTYLTSAVEELYEVTENNEKEKMK